MAVQWAAPILEAARKLGVDPTSLRSRWQRASWVAAVLGFSESLLEKMRWARRNGRSGAEAGPQFVSVGGAILYDILWVADYAERYYTPRGAAFLVGVLASDPERMALVRQFLRSLAVALPDEPLPVPPPEVQRLLDSAAVAIDRGQLIVHCRDQLPSGVDLSALETAIQRAGHLAEELVLKLSRARRRIEELGAAIAAVGTEVGALARHKEVESVLALAALAG